MRCVAAALALVCAALLAPSAAVAARQARHARVQAFLLTSAPESMADLRAHAAAIGVVYPTYFYCEEGGGTITGADDPAITAELHALHKVVMPRFSCQEGATVHRILTEPALRERTLAGLVKIARDPAYQGLSLDLENDGAGDREALSAFVAALAGRLHRIGKRLTVVVVGVTSEDPSGAAALYDDRAIAAAADTVFVLAWGTHWEGSAPGPIAPLPYVRAVAAYVASLPNASRFVLGAPMYGLDWPERQGQAGRATAYQYARILGIAHAAGATPTWEPANGEMTFSYTGPAGVSHRVWYLNAQAVLARLRIARQHELAIGVWRLGSEDQALWSSPLLGA